MKQRGGGQPHQRRRVGRGSIRRGGRLGMIVEFDPETFEQIRSRAIKKTVSFGEEVRTLVEWGLEAVVGERQP